MKVLVVGAGAVGQVYGYHLAKGGADVTFFVRPKYADEARQGFVLYPLNARGAHDPKKPVASVRFEGFGVVTSADEVRQAAWDAVVVTVSSSALAGPWLGELLNAAGDKAAPTIVTLQPGPDDRAHFLKHVPANRLVTGAITLASYHAPLPGETRFATPGMAYWYWPMVPAPFSGPAERTKAIVDAFRAGKLPAKVVRGQEGGGGGDPVLTAFMTWLAAFQAGGWRFSGLSEPELARVTHAASAEVLAIEKGPKAAAVFLRAPVLRGLLWVGAKVTPFPLEAMAADHFEKLTDQTRLILATTIAKGRAAALPTINLEALATRIGAAA